MAKKPEKDLPACPICGRARRSDFRPFCSARCADVDLNRWLSGRYTVPVSRDAPDAQDFTSKDIADLTKTSGQSGEEPL